jgi:hypothetical protein
MAALTVQTPMAQHATTRETLRALIPTERHVNQMEPHAALIPVAQFAATGNASKVHNQTAKSCTFRRLVTSNVRPHISHAVTAPQTKDKPLGSRWIDLK